MQILFDSQSTRYKSPFGCLRVGEVCRLALDIPDCCGAKEVALSLSDEEGFSLSVSFVKAEVTPPYTRYKTAFTLPRAGLYFYHFQIKTDKTTFSLYKRGDGTNMEEGERWQISCLPADLTTPIPFRGKVFYQIFPDRFYKREIVGREEKKDGFRAA